MVTVACDNRSSFKNLYKHLEEIENYSNGNTPIILILTKCDAPDDECIDQHITIDEIKIYGLYETANCIGVAQTSSKFNDNYNVHKAFRFSLNAAL